MSWGALPWWVYELEYEHHLAKMLGCMDSEWVPEWSRAVDDHTYKTLRYIRNR
jgi:hypothetical protein